MYNATHLNKLYWQNQFTSMSAVAILSTGSFEMKLSKTTKLNVISVGGNQSCSFADDRLHILRHSSTCINNALLKTSITRRFSLIRFGEIGDMILHKAVAEEEHR